MLITHQPYTGSTVSDGTQGPAQYGSAVSREVYGWYPQASDVPVGNDDLTLRVINSLVLLVPDVSPYKAGDKITVSGRDYRVSQDVRDYNTGPYGYNPGGTIVVESVSG